MVIEIEDFGEPEKIQALIKNLDLDIKEDTIKEGYSNNYFDINPRKVKRGVSPKEQKNTIENLKTLLTKNDIKSITAFIEVIKLKGDASCTEKLRDDLYKKIKKKLEKKSDTKEYKEIQKGYSYVSNVLCHLLSQPKKDYVKGYHEAWMGKKVVDRREFSHESDSEYLVLTDDEADYQAREYLEEGELWKMAVESGGTTSGLDDWVDGVLNMDGRASVLNHYDGCEDYETIEGTDYYIYRQN